MLYKKGLFARFFRFLGKKLIIPILRSQHPPEFTARGVMIGLAWAMTPLVGVQMYAVFMTWLATKKLFKWDFNLPIALAWTWVSNVFTMLPIYYVFYATGKLGIGRYETFSGYDGFIKLWKGAFAKDVSIYEALKTSVNVMVTEWGLAMTVGCVPWAILFAWLGYKYGLKYAIKAAARREARRKRKELAAQEKQNINKI